MKNNYIQHQSVLFIPPSSLFCIKCVFIYFFLSQFCSVGSVEFGRAQKSERKNDQIFLSLNSLSKNFNIFWLLLWTNFWKRLMCALSFLFRFFLSSFEILSCAFFTLITYCHSLSKVLTFEFIKFINVIVSYFSNFECRFSPLSAGFYLVCKRVSALPSAHVLVQSSFLKMHW